MNILITNKNKEDIDLIVPAAEVLLKPFATRRWVRKGLRVPGGEQKSKKFVFFLRLSMLKGGLPHKSQPMSKRGSFRKV